MLHLFLVLHVFHMWNLKENYEICRYYRKKTHIAINYICETYGELQGSEILELIWVTVGMDDVVLKMFDSLPFFL